MTGRGDEVKQRMDAVVSKSRVSLDAGLFGQDVIVLTLQVTNDLGEAAWAMVVVSRGMSPHPVRRGPTTYLASLSI